MSQEIEVGSRIEDRAHNQTGIVLAMGRLIEYRSDDTGEEVLTFREDCTWIPSEDDMRAMMAEFRKRGLAGGSAQSGRPRASGIRLTSAKPQRQTAIRE